MSSLSLTGKAELTTAHHALGSILFVRQGAYCRLNDIADVFGKRIQDWQRLKATKEILDEFAKDPATKGRPALKVVKGRMSDHANSRDHSPSLVQQGTWAHPDIAIEFARWCSPRFALWCNRQIRHLLTHGEVNLHHTEWTKEQHIAGIQYNRDDIEDMYGARR
jgi:hypothetical protein